MPCDISTFNFARVRPTSTDAEDTRDTGHHGRRIGHHMCAAESHYCEPTDEQAADRINNLVNQLTVLCGCAETPTTEKVSQRAAGVKMEFESRVGDSTGKGRVQANRARRTKRRGRRGARDARKQAQDHGLLRTKQELPHYDDRRTTDCTR